MDGGRSDPGAAASPAQGLGWGYGVAPLSGAWALGDALGPYGAGAGIAVGLSAAAAGVLGALLLARLEARAAAAGGLLRGAALGVALRLVFAALVIVPSFVGAAVWAGQKPIGPAVRR